MIYYRVQIGVPVGKDMGLAVGYMMLDHAGNMKSSLDRTNSVYFSTRELAEGEATLWEEAMQEHGHTCFIIPCEMRSVPAKLVVDKVQKEAA